MNCYRLTTLTLYRGYKKDTLIQSITNDLKNLKYFYLGEKMDGNLNNLQIYTLLYADHVSNFFNNGEPLISSCYAKMPWNIINIVNKLRASIGTIMISRCEFKMKLHIMKLSLINDGCKSNTMIANYHKN